MPNAETIFFIPYFESPRRSCPSTHLLTGSFRRAAAGSLVFAHSSLHLTKYPFSAGTGEKKAVIKQFIQKTDFHNLNISQRRQNQELLFVIEVLRKASAHLRAIIRNEKTGKAESLQNQMAFMLPSQDLKSTTERCHANSTSDKTQAALASSPLFFYCIVECNGLLSIKLDNLSFQRANK